MKAKAKNIADMYQRMIAKPSFALRSVRLIPLYVGLLAIPAVAWFANANKSDAIDTPTLPSNTQQVNVTAATPKASIPKAEGENNSMNETTPGASSSTSTNTSVQSDDTGTTVTVDGQTQTVPPNQSFHQSYDKNENNTTSHTDISVDNTTTPSESSVNLHVYSSTQSSSSTTNP